MNKKQKSNLGAGVVFLIFGIYIFYETLKLKGKERLASSGVFSPRIFKQEGSNDTILTKDSLTKLIVKKKGGLKDDFF